MNVWFTMNKIYSGTWYCNICEKVANLTDKQVTAIKRMGQAGALQISGTLLFVALKPFCNICG